MKNVKGKTIEEIMDKLNPQQRKIADKLRFLTKKKLPEITETVRWGNITYMLNGKDFSWIIFYKDHVDYGFFRGAELESKLLEGTGKGLRHIKIPNEKDVQAKEIERLLVEARKLDKQE
jgi:hypothetical protein